MNGILKKYLFTKWWNLILIFGISILLYMSGTMFLNSDLTNKPNEKLDLDGIETLIQEKTDLIIPKNFLVLENLIENTEGAFDSDYSISLSIKYKESDEKNIVEQILKSAEIKSSKGSWRNYKSGFDFEHNYNEINRAEPFNFKVDTLNNKIELNLNHL